jgi:hypothetical protein
MTLCPAIRLPHAEDGGHDGTGLAHAIGQRVSGPLVLSVASRVELLPANVGRNRPFGPSDRETDFRRLPPKPLSPRGRQRAARPADGLSPSTTGASGPLSTPPISDWAFAAAAFPRRSTTMPRPSRPRHVDGHLEPLRRPTRRSRRRPYPRSSPTRLAGRGRRHGGRLRCVRASIGGTLTERIAALVTPRLTGLPWAPRSAASGEAPFHVRQHGQRRGPRHQSPPGDG